MSRSVEAANLGSVSIVVGTNCILRLKLKLRVAAIALQWCFVIDSGSCSADVGL
jgi:hypothetical protein